MEDVKGVYCMWKYTQTQYPLKYARPRDNPYIDLYYCLPCNGFNQECMHFLSLEDLLANTEADFRTYYDGKTKRILFDPDQIYKKK